MESKREPRSQSTVQSEEAYDESVQQEIGQGEYPVEEDANEQKRPSLRFNGSQGRGGFVNGLSVGLGIGCIATFIIMWISVFFTPQIPTSITYETLLSIFIYPLIYLLAVGLIALTAGTVREYYSGR
jgi:hypothetical protein